ncbi:LCP family protein [Micrococcoides hystricis]|uniref:LCP family protein n=1 Tax=Micrococcoides hystricis TaxID=1572761 RepID=A0ABV6PC29_9MICC
MSDSFDGRYHDADEDYIEERPRKRSKWVIANILIVILGLVALAGVYGFSQLNNFQGKSHTFESSFPDEDGRPENTGATNILLLGSDSRGGSGESENLPTVPNGGRADTMMVVHIPEGGGKAYVMSIMRDFWVEIPGHGEAKINAALSYGGVPLAVETVENMMGIYIDHVAGVDFEGFRDVVNALGEVTIDVPKAFDSGVKKGHHFAEGPQTMDSETALAFVRERKAFSDGDYQRVRNQQAFMKGVFTQLGSRDILLNPGKTTETINSLAPAVTLDENFDTFTMLGLAPQMAGIRGSDIKNFTLPNTGTGWAQQQSVVWPDKDKIKELGEAINNNTLESWLSSQDL